MKQEGNIVIFFSDLKTDAKKRIVAIELETILDEEEVKVDAVRVKNGIYGYDPDPEKQELVQYVTATVGDDKWILEWDCIEHEFTGVMKEDQ